MKYHDGSLALRTSPFAMVLAAGTGLFAAAAHGQPTLYGPTAYTCFSDSPFSNLSLGYFYLETFEDHLFNVPGVQVNQGGVTSVVFGPSIHDSVDCDDGALDGSGLEGDSFFGAADMRFTFSAVVLGSLPTHAGLVWTDGGAGAVVTFEAFDPAGLSLGTVTGSHADGSNNGTTGEDRFYGVFSASGISSIRISHTSGGLEIDHLQYGGAASANSCLADINRDGVVDGADFIAFINSFGVGDPTVDALADVAGGGPSGLAPDGIIDGADFIAFINAFSAGC